jgi:hypothetical protein
MKIARRAAGCMLLEVHRASPQELDYCFEVEFERAYAPSPVLSFPSPVLVFWGDCGATECEARRHDLIHRRPQ